MPNPKAEAVMKEINAKMKKKVLFTLSGGNLERVPTIPSGSLSLDYALGGGWARGRMAELSGGEGAGKTTALFMAIAQCQQMGLLAGLIDAEHTYDPEWAEKFGVDNDSLVLAQPGGDDDSPSQSAEEVINTMRAMLQTGVFGLIGLDSLPALIPDAELSVADKEGMNKSSYGGMGAITSQMQRLIVGTGILHKSNTAVIGINQLREKIGVTFGNNEDTPGGRAWKHMATQRVKVTRGSYLEGAEQPDPVTGLKMKERVGNDIVFQVIKNKISPPYRKGRITILYDMGFDAIEELATLAIGIRVIGQSGAWFELPTPDGEKIKLQGKGKVIDTLRDLPIVAEFIKAQVVDLLNKGVKL